MLPLTILFTLQLTHSHCFVIAGVADTLVPGEHCELEESFHAVWSWLYHSAVLYSCSYLYPDEPA